MDVAIGAEIRNIKGGGRSSGEFLAESTEFCRSSDTIVSPVGGNIIEVSSQARNCCLQCPSEVDESVTRSPWRKNGVPASGNHQLAHR